MSTFYGDKNKAASLAGVNASVISDVQCEVVNEWIKSNIKWSGFEESESVTEYYDIRRNGQVELILNNFPVIEITEIVNGYNATNPEVLTDTQYTIDKESGIIQLINDTEGGVTTATVNDFIHYPFEFRQGFNSVKVVYKYGFAVVPDIISTIANLLLAKWLKIGIQQATADGLKSIKIADYSETYDSSFIGISSEFDPMLQPMIKKAQELYEHGV